MEIPADSYLLHYGTKRHSGRYPYGSGDQPHQGDMPLLARAAELKKQGFSDVDIVKAIGLSSTTELRELRSVAKNEARQDQIHRINKLAEKGLSTSAIAREMGINESQVRALRQPAVERKLQVLNNTSDMLRKQVDAKEFVDVGAGVEHHIGVTRTKMNAALSQLKSEGYVVHPIQIEQVGTGQKTNMRILTKPGVGVGEVLRNKDKIRQVTEYSEDGGMTMLGILPPRSVSSSRVAVRYGKDGGAQEDGVIYVRRGVDDLSLGKGRYAQVRIKVDDTHYLKGMAVYKDADEMPKGVDLLFNTNKSDSGNKLDAMKPLKDDPDNPFGATVRQITERGRDGKVKLKSAMNIVNEEGDWDKWSKTISSQVLSKQSPQLAKQQLSKAYKRREDEFNEIMRLTNPSVRRLLLKGLADSADSAAVHLKAAALPRQATQVLLPVPTMSPKEVYAPNFKDGEPVVLIRFPHGGTFEIPQLRVNNKQPDAKRLIGNGKDAVGIHPSVADRLSGADFDGDTVLVIPNHHGQIKTSPPLKGMEDFDAKQKYPKYEGMKVMSARTKGIQMGKVSNLITDMTIRRASADELARAVKHSMVVIDGEKHELDWKRSEQDNGIPALMKKYQGKTTGGAKTLVSQAGAQVRVNDRKQGYKVDEKTGERIYTETGRTQTRRLYKVDKVTGNRIYTGETTEDPKKVISKRLAETKDAHTLSSGTAIEKVYGDYSNDTKALANRIRLEMIGTKNNAYSPSAKKTYAKEVAELNAALTQAQRNAPLERQAQVIANSTVSARVRANPDLRQDKDQLRKIKGQALTAARLRMGVHEKEAIQITPAQWKAIEAGAITANLLDKILNYADKDLVRELATPRAVTAIPSARLSRARTMLRNGNSWADVADALGVSVTTLKGAIDGEEG